MHYYVARTTVLSDYTHLRVREYIPFDCEMRVYNTVGRVVPL